MSEKHITTDATSINNERVVNARVDVSENPWIIGVSKTHPGLKYYFNTVSGVSLWNISTEDIERAKQTMKAHGNQQYINCPEPKDPPPSRGTSTNRPTQLHSEHIFSQSKTYNKQLINNGLNKEISSFTCDICYTLKNTTPNVITVNFQHCPHSTCVSPFGNKFSSLPFNKIQSTTPTSEISQCNSTTSNILGKKRSLNRCVAELMVQDSDSEYLHSQGTLDKSDVLNQNSSNSGFGINLTPLKIFAKNGVIKDKWFIIADVNVYLHHIAFLKSVVNSDTQCCLMVPHHVKNELEDATKTELRTKAHCACYYIYKMLDSGLALIGEDNSEQIKDKSNEQHLLDSCAKLIDQNFYVVVLSDDLDLQKYRNKMEIPIFTVAELKECLCRIKSPESIYNISQSSTVNSIITNLDPKLKWSQNSRSSLVVNTNVTQVQGDNNVCKITADAEVQTNIPLAQLEKTKNNQSDTYLSKKEIDVNIQNELTINNKPSEKSPHHTNTQRPSKRIKLRRRRRVSDQCETNLSPKLCKANVSESHTNVSNTKTISCTNNILSPNQKLDDARIHISNATDNFKLNETISTSTLKQKSEESHYTVGDQILKPNQRTSLDSQSQNENITRKNVMFEVTTETMDQSLRRKCEEWVSRFVQIMEEALTQILRKFAVLYLPPPWNLYEATLCIGKKFENDEDVADATNNFLKVLNRISDEKGNVKNTVNPKEYMEMYSFGVYVIDALQGIFNTCEDLQIAEESLSKLLSDIQDPDADVINLEPFHCISQEEHFNNDVENPDENVEVLMIIETESLSQERSPESTECQPNVMETVANENDVPNNNIQKCGSESFTNIRWSNSYIPNEDFTIKHCNQFKTTNIKCNNKSQEDNVISTETATTSNTYIISSPSRYNLRSKQTHSLEKLYPSLSQEDDIDKNIVCKRAFLSNFMLQKNRLEENPQTFEGYFGNNIINDKSKESKGLDVKANANSDEPKIVRNFLICSEYEDRLRNRNLYKEMEDLDFEDDLMTTDDYVDEGELSGDEGRLYIDEFSEFQNKTNILRHIERETTRDAEYMKLDFKYFIRRIAQEIKELSSEVYAFSERSSEVLNSLSASDHKNEVREKAEEVHTSIDKICTALRNILNRDKNGGYNVQALLNIEFDDVSVDEEQMEAYGSFISRCLEQANVLNNTIKDVLSAVCEL